MPAASNPQQPDAVAVSAVVALVAQAKRSIAEKLLTALPGAAAVASTQLWNTDGFYRASNAFELALLGVDVDPREALFAVDATEVTWSRAFVRDGMLCRGLLRCGTMLVKQNPGARHDGALALRAAGREELCLDALTILVNGIQVQVSVAKHDVNWVYVNLGPSAVASAGPFRLQIEYQGRVHQDDQLGRHNLIVGLRH